MIKLRLVLLCALTPLIYLWRFKEANTFFNSNKLLPEDQKRFENEHFTSGKALLFLYQLNIFFFFLKFLQNYLKIISKLRQKLK